MVSHIWEPLLIVIPFMIMISVNNSLSIVQVILSKCCKFSPALLMHAKSWWHKWAQLISCQSSENAGGHLAFCDPKQHSKRHIRGLKKTPTCLLQRHAQQILNRPPSWGITKALGSFSSDTAGKVPSCLAGLVDSAASKSRSWDANHDLGARRSRLVSIPLASWSVSKWAQDPNRQSWSLKHRIGVFDWSRYLWALVTNWAASKTTRDSKWLPNDSSIFGSPQKQRFEAVPPAWQHPGTSQKLIFSTSRDSLSIFNQVH